MRQKHTAPPSTTAHGSMRGYLIGLLLSLILTAIAFATVMSARQMSGGLAAIVLIAAVAQILVQIVFFLHMDGRREQIWDTMIGLYSLAILLFIVLGSLWIFHHLHINTMMIGH